MYTNEMESKYILQRAATLTRNLWIIGLNHTDCGVYWHLFPTKKSNTERITDDAFLDLFMDEGGAS